MKTYSLTVTFNADREPTPQELEQLARRGLRHVLAQSFVTDGKAIVTPDEWED